MAGQSAQHPSSRRHWHAQHPSSIMQTRLRWLGHVRRIEDSRIPKDLLYAELREGRREVGCPQLRFKDVVKRDVPLNKEWTIVSRDRRMPQLTGQWSPEKLVLHVMSYVEWDVCLTTVLYLQLRNFGITFLMWLSFFEKKMGYWLCFCYLFLFKISI